MSEPNRYGAIDYRTDADSSKTSEVEQLGLGLHQLLSEVGEMGVHESPN